MALQLLSLKRELEETQMVCTTFPVNNASKSMDEQCSRYLMVDELIHQLIRKEMREATVSRPFLVPRHRHRATAAVSICAPRSAPGRGLQLITSQTA